MPSTTAIIAPGVPSEISTGTSMWTLPSTLWPPIPKRRLSRYSLCSAGVKMNFRG